MFWIDRGSICGFGQRPAGRTPLLRRTICDGFRNPPAIELLDQGFAAGAFRQVGSDKRVLDELHAHRVRRRTIHPQGTPSRGQHRYSDLPRRPPNGDRCSWRTRGDRLLRPTCGRSKGQQHLDRCRCCAVHSTIAHDTATCWLGPALRSMPMSLAPAALCG